MRIRYEIASLSPIFPTKTRSFATPQSLRKAKSLKNNLSRERLPRERIEYPKKIPQPDPAIVTREGVAAVVF